ncbi:MAG: DEAD/DEAH box helicase [Nitrosarchaeum sp.]|nr:DEAD/DEAH box helicase [Nitrosarchaeum sp.]
MSSLTIDDTGSLVLEYDFTGDYEVDFDLMDTVGSGDFKKIQQDEKKVIFAYPKTSNKVKFFKTAQSLQDYFDNNPKLGTLEISDEIEKNLVEQQQENELFQEALEKGASVKNKKQHDPVLGLNFKRKLLPFQKESVEHLLAVNNGANFSVPGSGKTTMTYAAVSKWLEDGIVEKIMVIGPTASFVPWEEEYFGCFGKKPRSLRIKGDIAEILENIGDSYDLFLLHYQTSNSKRMEIMNFLKKYKTVLIIDESHRIKNPNLGAWANAALFLAQFATRRIILSGTPAPNNYLDLWNQITFLWPHDFPLGNQSRYNDYVKKRGLSPEHRTTLQSLFCRVMKGDLHLPEPKFIPIMVDLGEHQRQIYDVIAANTLDEIESLEEQSRLQRFRIARMIRLLQSASNPSLLFEMSHEFNVHSPLFNSPREMVSAQLGFDVDSIDNNELKSLSISDKIMRYSDLEIPSKIRKVASLTKDLVNKGEKVLIWSSFLLNMHIYEEEVLKEFEPILIYGDVSKDPDVQPNRDDLVNRFKNDPDCKVLIATPASLGESVSLHKNANEESVCRNAIYLDRNFNGAQFMQSVDRIHRIGMPEDVTVNYHLVIGRDTIDEQIHQRLWEKWENMTHALDDPFLQTVEFDVVNESQDEFEQDYAALVKHLRELKSK